MYEVINTLNLHCPAHVDGSKGAPTKNNHPSTSLVLNPILPVPAPREWFFSVHINNSAPISQRGGSDSLGVDVPGGYVTGLFRELCSYAETSSSM